MQYYLLSKINFIKTFFNTQKYFWDLQGMSYILLSGDYKFLVRLIYVLTIFLSLLISIITYKSYSNNTKNDMEFLSHRLALDISEIITQYKYALLYMGKQIAHHPNNVDSISKIIGNTNSDYYKISNSFGWTSVDWLDKNNIRIISQKTGIVNDHIDFSHRSYTKSAKIEPWVLHFSDPDIGITSGKMIIPVGIGITNSKGLFIGTIGGGLDITTISRILEAKISPNYKFIVFNQHIVPTLYSSNISLTSQEVEKFKSKLNLTSLNPKLPISSNNILYLSHKYIKEGQYLISVGIKNTIFWEGYIIVLLPYLFILFCHSFCMILVIHLSNKKISNIISTSDEAERKLYNQINANLKPAINEIINYSSILEQSLKEAIEVDVTRCPKIKLAQRIHERATKIYNSTPDTININSFVDINEIIDEVIKIKYKIILCKKIYIDHTLQKNIRPLQANIVEIKQIIYNILSLAVDTTMSCGKIKIETFEDTNDNNITIIIKDTGLAIDIYDMERIQSNLNIGYGYLNIKFDYILNCIKRNNGKCIIESKRGNGRIITIIFKRNNSFNTNFPNVNQTNH